MSSICRFQNFYRHRRCYVRYYHATQTSSYPPPSPPLSSSTTSSSSTATFHTQVAVIGAGVVGLAIARAFALQGKEVLLIERNPHIAQETSSRNSEVIHAGIYYPSNTYKARLCVRGKQMIYEYCQERNIAFQQCGKLIVATTADQLATKLPFLQQQAFNNGVTDVTMLSQEDVKVLEPSIVCHGALYSPSTGIFDTHNFYLHLLADCEQHGTMVALNTTVVNAAIVVVDDVGSGGYGGGVNNNPRLWIQTKDTTKNTTVSNNDIANNDNTTWISCDVVVNAGGLWADQIANMFHTTTTTTTTTNTTTTKKNDWQPPRQYFAKGTYFSYNILQQQEYPQRSPQFSHLIYPVQPDHNNGGLGIHATLDMTGTKIKFGPDVEWLHVHTQVDQISYQPDPYRVMDFEREIRNYWPDLPVRTKSIPTGNNNTNQDDGSTSLSSTSVSSLQSVLQPDYVGIRPKLYHPMMLSSSSSSSSLLSNDFVIVGPETHGIPGLIHLLGIESPGLTSSLAMAEYIVSAEKHSYHFGQTKLP
jgi:L-2-hydroxyglutarate oxidase LhgO